VPTGRTRAASSGIPASPLAPSYAVPPPGRLTSESQRNVPRIGASSCGLYWMPSACPWEAHDRCYIGGRSVRSLASASGGYAAAG
jgi:hypothetical protein